MNRLGGSGSLVLLLDKWFSSCGGEGRREKKRYESIPGNVSKEKRVLISLCVQEEERAL